MSELNKEEYKITYNLINKFLKQFEAYPVEEKFWNKSFNLSELKVIRNKLEFLKE